MMNMKKMLALLLAVVMVVGMIPFGAMAEETVTHIETCLEGCALEDCACTCHTAPETPTEEPQQEQPPVAPASLDDTQTEETPVCTCTPVEGVHAAECALYVAPEAPVVEQPKVEETPVCTCTPVEDVHAVECALYVAPVVPEEAVKEEATPVDYAALYENIMNCNDLFEADAMVDALTEAQLAAFEAFMTEEQSAALDAHYAALIAAYEAEVPTESVPVDEVEEDTREIVYPTKDMTNAAPFHAPVEGPAMRLMRLFGASPVAEEEENGLILDKNVSSPDENGVYTITLEAYATGAKTTIMQESNVPTDIILVLDQSGSMSNSFTSTVFVKYTDTVEQLYNNRNSLYVKLPGGSYSPVTVTRSFAGTEETYTAFTGKSNSTYYNNRNDLYHKCDDDTYGKITVNRTGSSNSNRRYTYSCANCGSLGAQSNGSNVVPNYSGEFYLRETANVYQYTFSYEKEDGTYETATVAQNGQAPDWDFYRSQAGGSTTRLAALKTAVTNFSNAVAQKAMGADGTRGTEDDVDHTISVVGFANYSNYNDYANTEIFIGSNQYKYGTSARGQYANAPQDMSTSTGVSNVTASINALTASGATYVDLGIEMANGILDANPVPAGQKRNRVVIVFTDGVPGYSGSYNGASYGSQGGNAQAVADAAMNQVAITKNTHKATVYTVGIFTGADANSGGNTGNGASDTERANYFMQRLSSNTSYPQSPSYYLSASDSNALNNIFQTISENIENGGSSIELDENTVVKDIIADSFKLPEGANTSSIKVYTDGVDPSTGDFLDEPTEYAADVTISGKDISVTNFDFAENWVGSDTAVDGTVTYRGKKLIIEIPIVPNADFLGGNNIPTNGPASGVYNNGELVENFPGPDVDIDIKVLEIGLASTDQNIYLTNDADLAALVTSLDDRINGSNNAYVDIKYEIKDGDTVIGTVTIPAGGTLPSTITWSEAAGQDMTPNLDAFDSKTYTIVATASPSSAGSAKASTNTKTEPVNVFKPVVYFQDSEINAGETPDYGTDNFVKVEWKNGETLASDVTMIGTEPELIYTYNPVAEPLNAESEVQITAVATTAQKSISLDKVTFIRNACNLANGCGHEGGSVDMTKEGYINFIVHLKTCDLIITKRVVNQENAGDSFVFTVTGPNKFSKTVVINGNGSVTIADLPIGEYTVTEDTNWSWRYVCSAPSITKTIAPNNNTFAFTNTFDPDSKWLTDTSYALNLFGTNSATIK